MSEANLGTCCCCGGTESVRNLVMLNKKSPTPGRGWGCYVCGLLMDGAVAAVCDKCLAEKAPYRFVCTGYPTEEGRTPIEEVSGTHEHNTAIHAMQETPRTVGRPRPTRRGLPN